jgi:hypothetical protein
MLSNCKTIEYISPNCELIELAIEDGFMGSRLDESEGCGLPVLQWGNQI